MTAYAILETLVGSPLSNRNLSQGRWIVHRLPAGLIVVAAMLLAEVTSHASTIDFVQLYDGSRLHVRRSTPVEQSVHNSGEPAGTLFGDYTWQTADKYLWQTRDPSDNFKPVDEIPFTSSTPLTVAVPFFDYSQRAGFAVNESRIGNEFEIDAVAGLPVITTLQYRFPENATKEYLQLLDPLPGGRYSVVARFFNISGLFWGDADIDFDKFQQDPLGYELPSGASLNVIVERTSFEVVPEPSTAAQIGCVGILLLAARRPAKR
jgi:hypothetical protein